MTLAEGQQRPPRRYGERRDAVRVAARVARSEQRLRGEWTNVSRSRRDRKGGKRQNHHTHRAHMPVRLHGLPSGLGGPHAYGSGPPPDEPRRAREQAFLDPLDQAALRGIHGLQ